MTATTMEMTTTALTRSPTTTTKMISVPLDGTLKIKQSTTKSKRFLLLQTMAWIRREVA